ncbi:MAG: proteasome accessory factor PafA2 [Acidimicrobiaceae bacterium]|nr:proteasome accessory factor PafA2 [Acidimicrobiaceae bacterium]
MAVAKVCGIETEYGITVNGVRDANPISASSILINAYINELNGNVGWDFVDETPGNDARGFARDSFPPSEVESHLINTVLTNGARYYVDHAHPEYSSPECISPREAVVYDRAGEEVLRASMAAATRSMPIGQEIVVYKNNSDRKGNSYGCHENYLLDRGLAFGKLVEFITPVFVSRQVIIGAGKVGSDSSQSPRGQVNFQISQRADFFEEEVGLETTLKRPIVNTRDEPHADASKYRRLHVILGDANMSEVSSYLKVGTTAIVLSMIEDGFMDDLDLSLHDPVTSLRHVSYDLTLKRLLRLKSGKRITALEIQRAVFERACVYRDERGLDSMGPDGDGHAVLDLWGEVLDDLETDPMVLADTLDWVAKYRLVLGYKDRNNLTWDDPKLAAIDLQYHDIRPAKSLFYRVGVKNVVEDDEVKAAVTQPPTNTRAYFRGKCLERFGDSIAAANWDSMIFDLGSDPLRRVPMMDPLKGTKDHVGKLFDESANPTQLLDSLGS